MTSVVWYSADEGFDGTYQTNVVVRNNGSCLYVPPGIFKSTCKIDITWFPFDDQHCDMKFGSWTYDGNQLDLVLKDESGGDLSDFITNGEWYLIGMPGKKNTITYACCPEPYVDVTFTIMIRRRTLYYFFNLIVPCVLISSMALLGFTLPPDSGEKLTLGVSLSNPSSRSRHLEHRRQHNHQRGKQATDWIGELCAIVDAVVSSDFGRVNHVFDFRSHYSTIADGVSQPGCGDSAAGVTILLSQTVFSLLVGHVITKTSEAIPLIGTYFNCIMFMVASSVVLTVVVLNYHHRTADIHEMPQWIKTVFLQWLPWILRMSRPGKKITRKTIMMSNRMRELELKERSSKSLLANVLDIDDDFRHVPPPPNSTASTGNLGPGCSIFRTDFRRSFVRPSTMEDVGGGLGSHHRELHLILRELQFITARMKKADEEAELISDWKFAAMVVDRFCLFVFTLFTIIATVAVLLSAPHIIVQ
ncbi:unnamed protein product [Leptosia nina]|uniref:Neuronal acetylcholine receptor subunit alpha-7 n=1 Tax=Leptosia nina TaxID=320188 RepID=A0AAV1IWI5_9NEOP